jgi:hypothetical protein
LTLNRPTLILRREHASHTARESAERRRPGPGRQGPPGFARNYLIPQGKAKRATPENLKLLEERREELEKAAAEKLTLPRSGPRSSKARASRSRRRPASTAGCSAR